MTAGCRQVSNSPELLSASTMFERLIGRLSTEQQIGADRQARLDLGEPPPTARRSAACPTAYVKKFTKVFRRAPHGESTNAVD